MKLIEAFAGTIALSAWATGASSLIGYMGGKRALAPAIADAVGLTRGDVDHVWCADAGPWGDFWAHFAKHGLTVAEHFEARASEQLVNPAQGELLTTEAPPTRHYLVAQLQRALVVGQTDPAIYAQLQQALTAAGLDGAAHQARDAAALARIAQHRPASDDQRGEQAQLFEGVA